MRTDFQARPPPRVPFAVRLRLITDTEQGFLSWDNNVAERLIKLPVLGSKNFQFVGSPNAGRGVATMYSLVSSAKANGLEPFAWLRDVLTRLPYFRGGEAFTQAANGEPVTSEELDNLLPGRWLKKNPDHKWTIDEIRRKEQFQAKARKTARRRA